MSSLRRVAQMFLRRSGLGVSPPPYALKSSLNRGPELSSPHLARGFPSATRFEAFPEPGGSGGTLAGFPLTGWHRAFPKTRGPKVCPIPGWSGVSPAPVARSFPRTGGAELLLAARARSYPLPGGSGFPLRRLPSLVVENFYACRAGRTRGFGQHFQDSLAVHKPSTVNPRLSPGTGVSPPGFHRAVHRRAAPARKSDQPSAG
jgi:hypothetical protein